MKKNRIRLTESQLRSLIKGNIKSLLSEGKDRKQQARAKTKRIIQQHFNNSPMLNEPNEHTNGMPLIDFLEQDVMHTWFHDRTRSDAKGTFVCLEPLVTKIALENGWQQDRDNTAVLSRITLILNYIDELYRQNKIDPRTITNEVTTFDELNQMFGTEIDDLRNNGKQNRANTDFGGLNQNYNIIEVNTFEEAKRIGDYSVHGGELCYTQSKGTWKQFTSNGENKVYCCLTKDWQNTQEVHSESLLSQYPDCDGYDRYGLSMIFVFVDLDGNLVGSNTRWNHEATYGNGRSVDHALTEDDLSHLLGVPFEELFKPHSLEYRKEHGLYTFDEKLSMALERLANGEDIYEVFDWATDGSNGFTLVEINNKFNFLTEDGRLLSQQWFDNVDEFVEGFACVMLNGKFNFITEDGRLLSQQWFDNVGTFVEGFSRVTLNGKYNFLTEDGRILSQQWFDYVNGFNNGFARVMLNGKYNYLTEDGRLLSKLWFSYIKELRFSDGFIRVMSDGKTYTINTNGEILKESKIYNMKKNRIRLTESQLHRVIKESVNNVLNKGDFRTANNEDLVSYFNKALDDLRLLGNICSELGLHGYKNKIWEYIHNLQEMEGNLSNYKLGDSGEGMFF